MHHVNNGLPDIPITTLASSIAPWWFVLPVAAVTLLVVAGHWIALARSDMPAGRRRLRTANGLVMMMSVPVLAYGFGGVDTADHRRFVLAWMAASGLIVIVIALAGLDLLATFVFARKAHKKLMDEFAIEKARFANEVRLAREEAVAAASGGRTGHSQGGLAQRREGADPPGHDGG